MIAAEEIPYGIPVRLLDGKFYPCATEDMDGIAKRPHQVSHDRHYQNGEKIILHTDGGIMTQTGWMILRSGRLSNAS